MIKLLALLLALILSTPSFADGSFVAPTGVGTAAVGQIPGTATNDNACATCVGFPITSSINSGSAVNLTPSGTAINVTSISVTAGDWIVYGIVTFNGGGTTTVTTLNSGISTTSASLTNTAFYSFWGFPAAAVTAFVNNPLSFTSFPLRVSTSGTQTVYLVAQCTFGVSTCSAWGTITAYRLR